jgi:ribosomal protein L4
MQKIKQILQSVILKDRVKLEEIEREKSIKKSSNKYENVKIGIIIPTL